ncbi:MAG: hypothetical protein IK131_05200 [Paludibacteraceae bacterium]|nr:hypothetical protein [Paludibacteraceae bacterium]
MRTRKKEGAEKKYFLRAFFEKEQLILLHAVGNDRFASASIVMDLAKLFRNEMVSSDGDKQSSVETTSSVISFLLSSVQS